MTVPASPLRAFHASNLLTYASLVAGVAAIAFAAHGDRSAAGTLIAMSVLADTFDGRFARLFRRNDAQRRVGVELDSLSDAIAFGIAPAVCIGWWRLASAGPETAAFVGIFWFSVFAYAACAITRLACYNVTHEQAEGFVGLPVPVAALILATSLVFDPGIDMSVALFVTTAAAMVAPLPIPRPRGIGLAAFTCWPLVLIAGHIVRSA
jgi:CDP-diacylglycerol--serine O-phosphatidyltransferase